MVNVAAEAPAANHRLSMACMTKINNVVEAYNVRLAALVTNKDGDVMASQRTFSTKPKHRQGDKWG